MCHSSTDIYQHWHTAGISDESVCRWFVRIRRVTRSPLARDPRGATVPDQCECALDRWSVFVSILSGSICDARACRRLKMYPDYYAQFQQYNSISSPTYPGYYVPSGVHTNVAHLWPDARQFDQCTECVRYVRVVVVDENLSRFLKIFCLVLR